MMRGNKNKINLLILAVLFACIEPYDYNSIDINGDPLLVVDAVLTNEAKVHNILLSYTYGLGTRDLTTVDGAIVSIESGDGNIVTLTEWQPGNYATASTYEGIVGESYRLRIKTKNGHEYLSTEQTLNAAPPIDSLYGRYLQLPSKESGELLNGVQLFIDTDWSDYEVSTFRYVWEETYEWRVPYASSYFWDEKTETAIARATTDLLSVEKCFRGDTSNSLLVGSSLELNKPKLTEFPVHFINEDDPNLAFKTAVNIKQYAVSTDTYQYYKRLKENNESGGSLFDKQKGNIVGNIEALTDPQESVMGNFEVSGVSSKLAFFESRNFLAEGFNIPPLFRGSNISINGIADSIPTSDLENYFSSYLSAGKGIWTFDLALGLYVMLPEGCTDCRIQGNIEVPNFWE